MFSDVPISSVYYKAAEFCSKKGIINGTGGGKFSPNDKIIVEHWCIMLTRAFAANAANPVNECYSRGWINTVTVQYPESQMCREILYESAFKAFRVDTYGQKIMDVAVKIGVCTKLDKPTDIMNRGEAILTIYKLMNSNAEVQKPKIVTDVNLINVDGCDTSDFVSELNKIPMEIIAKFKAQGWKYSIDSRHTLGYNSPNVNCSGVTEYSSKTLYVTVPGATLHEFGHFLQAQINKYALIETIFVREGKTSKFLSNYSTTNSSEFFAEAFAYFINNKNNQKMMEPMRAYLPATYAFFTLLEFNDWSQF